MHHAQIYIIPKTISLAFTSNNTGPNNKPCIPPFSWYINHSKYEVTSRLDFIVLYASQVCVLQTDSV